MATEIKPQDLVSSLLGQAEHLIGRTVAIKTVHIANVPGRTAILSGRPALGKQVYRLLAGLAFTPLHLDILYTYGGTRKDGQWITTVSYNSLVGFMVIHTTIPERITIVEAPSRLKGK